MSIGAFVASPCAVDRLRIRITLVGDIAQVEFEFGVFVEKIALLPSVTRWIEQAHATVDVESHTSG